MVNDAQVLYDFLVSKTALTTLTGSRIWGLTTDPPQEDYQPADGPAITFTRRGGSIDYARALLTTSWQFRCYGSDLYVRDTLYRTLVDVLDGARGKGLRSATLENAGAAVTDPDTGWEFVLVFFETQMRSELATV